MKLLTLIRHAKSDWDNDFPDFERPLNHRGLKDAPQMGKWIAQNLSKPELLISSSAARAKTTAQLIAGKLNYNASAIVLSNQLYHCENIDFLSVLQQQPNSLMHIMVFGHNPGITGFVNYLSNAGIENLPTCGLAHFELFIDYWHELSSNCGNLRNYTIPGMLKNI